MISGVLPLPVRRAPGWVDPVLAAAAAALAVAVFATADTGAIDPALHPASVTAGLVTAVGAAGVGWRRTRPLLGLLTVTVGATVVSASGHYTGLLPYLTMLALYAVAAYGARRQAVPGLAVVVAAFLLLSLAGVPDLTVVDVATSAAFCVAATALGDAVRQRRTHQAELLTAAEASAVAAAERAVADERLRIARELHDVVAHSMSLIAVQAGVGAHLLRHDPDAAERALTVIAETSRAALAQTRSVVGLLRSGDDAQPSMPGLASLDALAEAVRGAGLVLQVTVAGVRRELPPAVDLAAYRIVQEALTNAVKHAPDRPVTLCLTYGPTLLCVEVGEPGQTGPLTDPDGGGFGLVGLHERARILGGHLVAGSTGAGGFTVHAELPTAAP